jgi:hypothetical protein
MDPYAPPKAPPPLPEPPEAKPRGLVPLNIASALIFLGLFVSWGWRIDLAAFLFSLTGLLIARAKPRRIQAIGLCCITAILCLFKLLLGQPF